MPERSIVAPPARAACPASAGIATTGTSPTPLEVEGACRQLGSGDEHGARSRLCRVAGPALDRSLVCLHDDGLAGDEADPVRAEEVAERVAARQGASLPVGLGQRRPGNRRHLEARGGLQGCAAEEANRRGEHRVGADAQLGVGLQHLPAGVERPHRERLRGGGWCRDRPEPDARAAVVPDRSDHERPEMRGAGGGPRLGAVREGRVRLHAPDERDRGAVLDVAVAVGIDGPLQPGEQEVAAPQDSPAPLDRLSPAHDPDRQDPRARRDPLQAGRPVVAGEEPAHPRPVGLDDAGLARLRLRHRVRSPSTTSKPRAMRPLR